MSLWGGRFTGGPAEQMQAFSESLGTDLQMWPEDIQGSIAHATMLMGVGLLTEDEHREIVRGLESVAQELEQGWKPGIDQEDIHMAVEGLRSAPGC